MKKNNVSVELKQVNKKMIFEYLMMHEEVSKRELFMELGLSIPTATQHINALIADGLVTEVGSVGNTGGRKAAIYSGIKDAKIAVGIDITRHHVSFAAVNLLGEAVCEERFSLLFSREESYFQMVGQLLETFIQKNRLKSEAILGVGIGVPGITTANGSEVRFGETIGITGVKIQEFSKYISYPTRMVNDANAAGFAETWLRDTPSNMFYILLSSFVGGAIIINGEVYSGDALRSGEIGHVIIHENGRRCYCGRSGCADPYLASTNLSNLTDGNLSLFFEKLRHKEPEICAAWEQYLQDLSIAIEDVRMLFNCKIVIGGYVGAYMGDYLEQLKEIVKSIQTHDKDADYITACKYQGPAIAAGAALFYVDDFLNHI